MSQALLSRCSGLLSAAYHVAGRSLMGMATGIKLKSHSGMAKRVNVTGGGGMKMYSLFLAFRQLF